MFSDLKSESSGDDSSDEEIILYGGVNPHTTHVPLHQQAVFDNSVAKEDELFSQTEESKTCENIIETKSDSGDEHYSEFGYTNDAIDDFTSNEQKIVQKTGFTSQQTSEFREKLIKDNFCLVTNLLSDKLLGKIKNLTFNGSEPNITLKNYKKILNEKIKKYLETLNDIKHTPPVLLGYIHALVLDPNMTEEMFNQIHNDLYPKGFLHKVIIYFTVNKSISCICVRDNYFTRTE